MSNTVWPVLCNISLSETLLNVCGCVEEEEEGRGEGGSFSFCQTPKPIVVKVKQNENFFSYKIVVNY
jgi:hypothetical protein